jgi:DNA polymerase III epsilon subunit-like protein
MSDLHSNIDLGSRRLAILSVRATGFDPNTDRIIEVAAVIHARGKEPKTYHRLVFPGVPILPDATRDHGLTDADVATAPPFESIASGFARFLGAADLAGFDIRRFALPLLWAEFHRCSVAFNCFGRSVVDLRDIYRRHEPRDLESAVDQYLGRTIDDRRRCVGHRRGLVGTPRSPTEASRRPAEDGQRTRGLSSKRYWVTVCHGGGLGC